jgi:cytoskeletal protein CcmA (bactofilin family)
MKYLLLAALASLTFTNTVLAADKCAEASGNMTVGKVTLQCLKVIGTAKFEGTTLEGALNLTGPLEAKSTHFSSLKIMGNAILTDSTVTGIVKITGGLDAKNTIFLDKIVINGKSALFSHSTLKDIDIIAKARQKASITLEDESIVNGNITFTTGNGIVINHHATLNGKIIGGKME